MCEHGGGEHGSGGARRRVDCGRARLARATLLILRGCTQQLGPCHARCQLRPANLLWGLMYLRIVDAPWYRPPCRLLTTWCGPWRALGWVLENGGALYLCSFAFCLVTAPSAGALCLGQVCRGPLRDARGGLAVHARRACVALPGRLGVQHGADAETGRAEPTGAGAVTV